MIPIYYKQYADLGDGIIGNRELRGARIIMTLGKKIINNIKNAVVSISFKRTDSIVAIDAWMGSKYADNSRYLFQYLSDHKKELGLTQVVWLTRNPEVCWHVRELGYEAFLIDSEEGIGIHKKAGYLICNNVPVDDINLNGEFLGQYSYGAKKVNLWHGTGAIKTFAMDSNAYKAKVNRHPILYSIKKFLYSHLSIFRKFCEGTGGWGDCYFLTTSKHEKVKFRKCYPMPDKHFIISNFPRNCRGVKMSKEERKITETIEQYKYSILYLPTFRDSDSKFDHSVVADTLRKMFQKKGILLIQKAHFVMTDNGEYGLLNNVLTLRPDFDVNVISPVVTYVMTDYSSILADALYHRKPVLLYVPDYHEYMAGERGFSADAELLLSAGIKFYNLDELQTYLEYNVEYPERAKTYSYIKVRARIWEREVELNQIWKDIKKACSAEK